VLTLRTPPTHRDLPWLLAFATHAGLTGMAVATAWAQGQLTTIMMIADGTYYLWDLQGQLTVDMAWVG
jgi:hypothetical protein